MSKDHLVPETLATKAPSELRFRIRGMDCAEEVAVLRRELGPLVSDQDRLGFDVLNAQLTVAPGSPPIEAAEVIQAVSRTGMKAELWREDAASPSPAGYWERHARIILTGLSGLAALLGWIAQSGFGYPRVAEALFAVSILAGVWQVLPKAWLAARRLAPDMNLLMTVAVCGAIGIGEWLEAATVSFLFALSLALEAWSVGRARRSIAALLDLAPPKARLVRDGKEELVAPESVAVGETFVVKPGEKIPLDGNVLKGASAINQAPITGESVPVEKQAGDLVFAGTINGDGALEVECVKGSSETTLAQIIRLVQSAQSKRAPAEQWVEKFARVYTPAVMAAALLLLLVPPFGFGEPWGRSLYRSLVLLVIACPCALVISTPVSIVAGLAAAARRGVLIKGGAYLEACARLKAIAFDKTGTLTQGRPAVVEVAPLEDHNERELLERAAALEERSSHPLAQAIVARAREAGLGANPAADVQVVQGRGVTGRFDGREFWLGSHRWLEERGQETEEVHRRLEELSSAGRTVVVVGNDAHVCGFIALADAVRPEAKAALDELRRMGIKRLVMLTGDNRGTAEAVARELGVSETRSELLPADKVAAVEELTRSDSPVAMIGDGVNDAPALARASVGIAMGVAGTDAALEAADIALMSDELKKLPWLVSHARRTLGVIRQNIAFSLGVKAVFVILTFADAASLWAAIAADTGASLVVIANGLRLLKTDLDS